MPKQSITWILLPAGTERRGPATWLRLSCFVSPRLDPTGGANRLDPTFPDFAKWPDLAPRLRFEVEVQGIGTRTAERVSRGDDAVLWAKLFADGAVPVAPFAFKDMSKRALRSFPMRGVTGRLRAFYRDLAATSGASLPRLPFAPGGNPLLQQLASDLGDVVDGGRRKEQLARIDAALAAQPNKPRALPPGWNDPAFPSQAQTDFLLADRFYARPEFREPSSTKQSLANIPPRPKKPRLDFHQIVAALADHPQLLRRLGLVIDLAIPADGIPATSSMRLLPAGRFRMATQHATPWTRCRLDGELFVAAPRGSQIDGGQLKLTDVSDDGSKNEKQPYDIVTLDGDGAAHKLIHFAQTMRRQIRRSSAAYRQIAYSMPEEGGAATLQSGGVALVESGRAFRLGTHLKRQAAVDQAITGAGAPPNLWGDPHVLFAEDVLRGYRADIEDAAAAGRWRSLMQRVGTYTLKLAAGDETVAGIVPDEGYVKAESASSKDSAASDLYLHETLFKWTGWSLVAPRPGRTIVPETQPGGFTQRERIAEPGNEPQGDTPLSVTYRVQPGSLPRLRFGSAYRMRVRTVDLAGNSLPPELADDSRATARFAYQRYEAITPPMLLPRDAFGEGASLERMVIRSNFDIDAAAYASSAPVQAALAGAHYAYGPQDDRHVVPPKTSQLMAETHGLFDAQMGAGPAGIVAAFNVAAKEAGTYLDTAIVDTATGKKTIDVSANLQLVTPPGVPASPPPPMSLPLKPADEDDPVGERLAPGQYVVYPPARLHLPYLPDPIARGVALRGVPNAVPGVIAGGLAAQAVAPGTVVIKVPFDLSWPKAEPFRIVLRERPGAMPPADAPAATLCQQVFSEPGRPIWDPAARTLTLFLGKAETARILYSCHPDKADVDLMALWRWIAGHADAAQLRALVEAGCHWMFTPYRELALVHAVQQPLCEPRFARVAAMKDKIGDTHAYLREPLIRLSAKSTAKLDLHASWEEWLDDVSRPEPVRVKQGQHVLELPIDQAWGDELVQPEIGANRLRHEFGDTRHRLVRYHFVATTRFREYFPPAITRDPANITRVGPAYEEAPAIKGLRVPNSARPLAPRPLYVVPSFKWQTTRSGSRITSRRIGRGLRVWLERPWFSSGDGELLGVVLDGLPVPAAGATPAQMNAWLEHRHKVKAVITQRGKDPIFDSTDPPAALTGADFPLAVAHGGGLSLDEQPAMSGFAVAGHEVEFDPARKLWFADIEVAAGSAYFPFVRLALARYQPNSRQDCHLSRVFLAEFSQLVPDRRVEVTVAADKRTLSVELFGIEPKATGVSRALLTDPVPAGPFPKPTPPPPRGGLNEFDFRVEVLDPALGADFGWSPLAGVAVSSTPVRGRTATARRLPTDALDLDIRVVQPLWKGKITLPEPLGGRALRLVAREFELFHEDAEDVFLGKRIARRLVYADTIEL